MPALGPVWPQEQTFPDPVGTAQLADHALQQGEDYSITSSARNVGGTLMPSCLAVLALITSRNLLACSSRMSPDFSMDATTSSFCLQAQQIMFEAYGERFRPRPLLKQRLRAGYVGGRGRKGWRN